MNRESGGRAPRFARSRGAGIGSRCAARAIVALQGGLVAVLLVAFAASAQEETPEEAVGSEAAIEAATGEAEGVAEGGAEAESEVERAAEADAADALGEGQYSIDDLQESLEPELPEGIEEIKVTSERGMGTPQDAPISTIGFDADVILKEGIRDIRDLSNFTPSLEIKSAFAASNPTIFIRGVGLDDFNANAASAVAIYQDGIYMQSPAGQLFQFFDVEGVEVLRGPQGALYRNASAGAILVNSRKPTEDFEAYTTVTVGNYRYIELVGAISGPIVPDLVSGRLSGSWGVRDGITENRCAYLRPDQDPCDRRDKDQQPLVQEGIDRYTNDMDAYGVRGQLLFKPRQVDTEWLFNIHGGQNFSRAYQYQHRGVKFFAIGNDPTQIQIAIPQPLEPPKPDSEGYTDTDGDPYAGDYNVDGPEMLNLWGTNLKGVWRFDHGYELESITGYEWHDRLTQENSDGSPNLLQISYYGDTAWQVSQELNLMGEWTPSALGDGSWILGAFYLQEDLHVTNVYEQLGVDFIQDYTQKMRNFAAYAQSDYKIQPGCVRISCDFTLDLGLRYNLEYKSFDIVACGTVGGNCGLALEGSEDDTWDGLSGDISLAWHFYGDNNVYVKFSHGWKGGHFNGGASGRFDLITPVEPEIVDSWEVGLRSLWFDDRLMLNLTGFWYDYQDLQVFQLQQTPAGYPIAKLVNANDALVYGIELDMGATPFEGVNMTLNASWVESEYLDFKVGLPFTVRKQIPGSTKFFPPITFLQEFDYSGNPLIASPHFSVTGSIDYRIPLPQEVGRRGLGYITPRFSFSWKDDVFYDATSGQGALQNFPTGTFGQEAFWIFNASLSWLSPEERVEVTGWVHNMTNELYKTQSFDISRGYNIILDAFADPRTYGITVSLAF
jgi:iron complex outermembrane receptor protein